MSGSSVLKKLPPEVARELRRHVSPRPLPKPGQKPVVEEERKGMSKVLAGCIALTATAASFPLLATWWIGNLNEKVCQVSHTECLMFVFDYAHFCFGVLR